MVAYLKMRVVLGGWRSRTSYATCNLRLQTSNSKYNLACDIRDSNYSSCAPTANIPHEKSSAIVGQMAQALAQPPACASRMAQRRTAYERAGEPPQGRAAGEFGIAAGRQSGYGQRWHVHLADDGHRTDAHKTTKTQPKHIREPSV